MEEIYWNFGRIFCLSLFSVEAANSVRAAANCYQIAYHYVPEDSISDGYCCEKLKCDRCVHIFL
jgi:hypothetical protein